MIAAVLSVLVLLLSGAGGFEDVQAAPLSPLAAVPDAAASDGVDASQAAWSGRIHHRHRRNAPSAASETAAAAAAQGWTAPRRRHGSGAGTPHAGGAGDGPHLRHRHRRSGGRCAWAYGPWCGGYYTQPLLPFKPPPVRNKPCPGGCSGVGDCRGDLGVCECPAGWGGPSCSQPAKRPCTNGFRLPRNATEPKSFVGPDGRDLDWTAGGATPSRCAGICDDAIAACYCDPKLGNPKYGRIPAPPGSPPGTPPVREGRPLLDPCSHPSHDGRGRRLPWGAEGVRYEDIYGREGWCVADKPNITYCGCPLDGRDGPGCNKITEAVCPNQCSARGRCRLGFCECNPGWWGLDCAHAASASDAAAAAATAGDVGPWQRERPRWLQRLAFDGWGCAAQGRGCASDALQRVDEEWQAELDAAAAAAATQVVEGSGKKPAPPAADATPAVQQAEVPFPPPTDSPPQSPAAAAEAESDAASAGGDADDTAGGQGLWRRRSHRAARRSSRRSRALQEARGSEPSATAGKALASPAAAGRRRPLIYVYDVPAAYVSRLLSYRILKDTCSWRWFLPGNETAIGFFTYATESLLLELLLSSPHRTLDPEEADFFFVPSYSSCLLHPVLGWADHPWWYTRSFQRINHAVVMTNELLRWVKTAHPYWNRTGGADHIWHFAHDEGACWAPTEVYERSVIITHWGRMDGGHSSGTSYGPDDYSRDVLDDPGLPGGFRRLIAGHPCYTPGKDVVMPSFEAPERYHASPFMGAPQPPRDILLYHRGRMGQTDGPRYSRGVRQRILRLARRNNWRERYRIQVETYNELDEDYSQQLARSVFCLVASGDGWTSRFDDAVLHGCIPVVIIDDVVGPWAHQLRWSAFSVRVSEADVATLPEVLTAIPPARVRAMQRVLAAVWRRFAWLSHPEVYNEARKVAARNAEAHPELRRQGGAGRQEQGGGGGGAAGAKGPRRRRRGMHGGHLFAPGVWRDDAFQTLLQSLHYKLEARDAATPAAGAAFGNASTAAAAAAGEDADGEAQEQ